MGTCDAGIDCPNCGNTATQSVESKPFTRIYISCYECGFIVAPVSYFLSLNELNELRKEIEVYDEDKDEDTVLNELAELPKQNEELKYG